MELSIHPTTALADLPASELWGRDVFDLAGQRMGTIDSIARSSWGPVNAIVRTARRPHRLVFVNLEGAVMDGETVVVASIAASNLVAEATSAPSRPGLPRLTGWLRGA